MQNLYRDVCFLCEPLALFQFLYPPHIGLQLIDGVLLMAPQRPALPNFPRPPCPHARNIHERLIVNGIVLNEIEQLDQAGEEENEEENPRTPVAFMELDDEEMLIDRSDDEDETETIILSSDDEDVPEEPPVAQKSLASILDDPEFAKLTKEVMEKLNRIPKSAFTSKLEDIYECFENVDFMLTLAKSLGGRVALTEAPEFVDDKQYNEAIGYQVARVKLWKKLSDEEEFKRQYDIGMKMMQTRMEKGKERARAEGDNFWRRDGIESKFQTAAERLAFVEKRVEGIVPLEWPLDEDEMKRIANNPFYHSLLVDSDKEKHLAALMLQVASTLHWHKRMVEAGKYASFEPLDKWLLKVDNKCGIENMLDGKWDAKV